MDPSSDLYRPGGFRTVVVTTGHMTDLPDRSTARFPEHGVAAVRSRIERTMASWDLGEGDLLICGGARGGDLLAARTAHRLGVTVWLLLAQTPAEFAANSVDGSAAHWVDDFRYLVHRVPSWVIDADVGEDEPGAVYAATNAWMLTVAAAQSEGRPVRVLAVWDGRAPDGPGGAADMVEQARAMGADVTIIDPARPMP